MQPNQIIVLINQSPMNRGLDGASWVSKPGNVGIAIGETVVILERQERVAEFHWLRSSKNPRATIRETREALKIYLEANAKIKFLYGLVPTDRRDSMLMARWIGATPGPTFLTGDGYSRLFTFDRSSFHGIS